MEVKQFWLNETGLNNFNKTAFSNGNNLSVTIPKSLVGKGRVVNTATQVDEFLGKTGTIDGQDALNTFNKSIKTYNITPINSE